MPHIPHAPPTMQSLIDQSFATGRNGKRYGSTFDAMSFAGRRSGRIQPADGFISPYANMRPSGSSGLNVAGTAASRPFELTHGLADTAGKIIPSIGHNEDVNPRVVMSGRRFAGLGTMGTNLNLEAPDRHELLMIYRIYPKKKNAYVTYTDSDDPFESGQLTQYSAARSDPTTLGAFVQGSSTVGGSPIQIAYMMAHLQSNWAKDIYNAHQSGEEDTRNNMVVGYARFRPTYFIFGFARHPLDEVGEAAGNYLAPIKSLRWIGNFEGFSLDGCVRHLEAVGKTRLPLQLSYTNEPEHGIEYVASVAARGRETILDYWDGRGVYQNARLYIVYRKYAADKYERPDPSSRNDFLFHMASRPSHIQTNMSASAKIITMPPIIDEHGVEHDPLPILPAFVAVPSGGPLPREYLEYTDEFGNTCIGHAVYVGRVLTAPRKYQYLKPPTPDQLRPFMDARKSIDAESIEIIMNVDDGLHTML